MTIKITPGRTLSVRTRTSARHVFSRVVITNEDGQVFHQNAASFSGDYATFTIPGHLLNSLPATAEFQISRSGTSWTSLRTIEYASNEAPAVAPPSDGGPPGGLVFDNVQSPSTVIYQGPTDGQQHDVFRTYGTLFNEEYLEDQNKYVASTTNAGLYSMRLSGVINNWPTSIIAGGVIRYSIYLETEPGVADFDYSGDMPVDADLIANINSPLNIDRNLFFGSQFMPGTPHIPQSLVYVSAAGAQPKISILNLTDNADLGYYLTMDFKPVLLKP